jgi:hypothetical protein
MKGGKHTTTKLLLKEKKKKPREKKSTKKNFRQSNFSHSNQCGRVRMTEVF